MFSRILMLLLLAPVQTVCASEGDGADDDLRKIVEQQGREIERLKHRLNQAQSAPPGKRKAELNEAVDEYLDDTDQGAVRGVAAGWSSDPNLAGRRVRIGGYFSIEYRDDGDGNNGEFDLHRLVIKIQADIAKAISFDTEIEIEGGGADVDFLTDNEILVEYAELRFELWESYITFDAGLILIPWGRFNFYHDDPYQDLTDRPLVARRIAAVAFGQPGVAIDGTVPFAGGWFVDYKVALVQGFGEEFTTNGGARDARQSFREDNNNNKQWFGRVIVSPPVQFVDNLEFGGSFNVGKWDDDGDLKDYGWAAELHWKRGRWEFTGEFMTQRIEQLSGADPLMPRRQSGWYVDIAYHFFPKSWVGKHALFTDESTFTLIVRVEEIDLNHSTTGDTFRDDLERVTIGFNFRPVERTVFKISYAWQDSKLAGFESGSADIFVISWATYF